ncbi:DNA/RNA helicase domain-containing protein [Roseomonas sp. AR75]|uniref:DNA/RNA helicase domain-containing protein n=1 Tax=Roseomonas sp. AR75 TaxID=2562311 RepID=UPI0010C08FF3|nr:DNA/RNA helicase domain-containing protein [Roseomonas sp. AR75]
MRAWFACTGAELLTRDPRDTVGRLASAQQGRGYPGAADQEFAWQRQVAALRNAIAEARGEHWTVVLEYDLLRLEKRIDAVVLTDRAILAIEFKTGAPAPAMAAEAEDYALDLRDFHAGSRAHPIVPLLVAGDTPFVPPAQPPLLWYGVTAPMTCGHATLGAAMRWVQSTAPEAREPLDGAAWLDAPYRPVPTIIEAATMLYARNGVAEIATARADTANLTRTAEAIRRAVRAAQAANDKRVVVVTGIPGAGKTLCGLNAVFAPEAGPHSAFLTGNVPLVEVLRAALAQDAVARRECGREEAMRRAKQRLQNVHRFLEDGAMDAARRPPVDRLIVFDEAQRAWNAAKAQLGTRNKPSKLTMSEPAHTLEIMGRHQGWAVIVALIGNGQEINTGEAGVAEWGHCVAASNGAWRAVAAARAVDTADPVQRLADGWPDWLDRDDDLDLAVPVRSVRDTAGAAWVDAVLRGAVAEARDIAAGAPDLPFLLTRDLDALRAALRRLARGRRRAGLVAAAGAKRLRADGLGVQAEDVADWFLRRWPDVRASDALETFATEYDCQGLELDVVGLAWGGDLLWRGDAWLPRRFAGKDWQTVRNAEERRHIVNTYRVLLTRARYETVIWVPRGSREGEAFHDATRDAGDLNAIAGRLLACGARPLEPQSLPEATAAPALL